jgi:hypothetical protein
MMWLLDWQHVVRAEVAGGLAGSRSPASNKRMDAWDIPRVGVIPGVATRFLSRD